MLVYHQFRPVVHIHLVVLAAEIRLPPVLDGAAISLVIRTQRRREIFGVWLTSASDARDAQGDKRHGEGFRGHPILELVHLVERLGDVGDGSLVEISTRYWGRDLVRLADVAHFRAPF